MLTGLNMLARLGQREVTEGTMANERMCAGMVMEAADLYSASRSEQAYFDAIGGKTAHLFALACRLGAMQAERAGGRPGSREEALAGFGWQFGYAYQLRDDILDLTSTAEKLGKPVNTDLSEGVYTLPVILAASRDRGLAHFLGKELTQDEAVRARDLVLASGAVQEAQAAADAHMAKAADELSRLSDHPHALEGLTAYARAVLDRPAASRPAAIPRQVRQDPQSQDSVQAQQVTRWLKGWLVETGIAATPAEADHHRLSGALSMIERIIPRVADGAGNADGSDDDLFERKQTSAALGLLFGVWDDLFEDPQLTDPQAVTALRQGLVTMLRQDPGAPWTHGAISTSWGQLWPRLCNGRTVRWQEALLDNIEEWLHACEREAGHRISGYIPSTADWLPLRRSTGGFEVGLACSEIVQDREMPPAVRSHRMVRRLEDLGFFVVFAENDLAGVDQDEADQVPYNLVRAMRHEMGCSRAEAIERVERQVAEKRAQFTAVYEYAPVLFRTLPGLSGQGDRYEAIYDMLKLFFDMRQGESERYQPQTAAAGPDLERLRREISRPAAQAQSTR